MSVAKAIFSNFGAFLMALIMTVIPYKGISLPVLETKEADCQLNVSMISDIHLEANGFFRQGMMKQGLRKMANSKSPIDALVITGDITNYGDEEALKQYYELIGEFAEFPVITTPGNHDIGHAGDRGIGIDDKYLSKANFIKYHKEFYEDGVETIYYSMEINGYKFISLGDEVDGITVDAEGNVIPHEGGHWDAVTMTLEQLDFLDRELAEGTKDGKPVFVCCHWPIKDINSEDTIWPDSGIDPAEYNLPAIMEKYNNVFYISGHMHSGVKATVINDWYGINSAEQVNGVTYLSLPSYGLVNSFGYPLSGTGAQLEVYKDKIIFRPMDYLTGHIYNNSEYTFELK